MKKTLWTMAAALALTGCSQDDLLNVDNTTLQEKNAVAFSTYVGDNAQSRATVVTTQTLGNEGFGVNAWYTGSEDFTDADSHEKFMDNTKVTYNADKGAWTYSPLKYWPNNDGDKVSFFAYGPYGNDNIAQNGTGLDFTVAPEVKDQVDLIYNTNHAGTMNQTKPAVDSKINFTFAHALSRISFTVEAAVDEVTNGSNLLDGNTRINVKKVALVGEDGYEEGNVTGPFYTGGTLSLLEEDVDAPWSETTGEQGFVFDATNFYHTVKDNGEDVVQLTRFNASEPQRLLNDESYLMVIPQEASFKIYIEYDVISEGNDNDSNGNYDESKITNSITSKEVITVDFQKGMAYNFNLVLGMTSVKFEVDDVLAWEDAEGDEEWLPENSGGEPQNASKLTYRDGKFIIATAEDLVAARDYINADATYTIVDGYAVDVAASRSGDGEQYAYNEASYLQTADIDLNNEPWTPIGLSDKYFQGIYDVEKNESNAYYTISNLQVNVEDDNGALFGYIKNAQLSNIHIASCNVTAEDAAAIVGAAYEDGGETVIDGCVVGDENSLENSNCTIVGTDRAAGIVAGGGSSYITVSNCTSYAEVSTAEAAEIAGIGCHSYAAYIGCYNYGNVTADYTDSNLSPSAAGIACHGADYIEDCHNFGVITSKNNSIGGNASGIVSGECRYIYACHNEGTINGNYAGGGISGSLACTDIKACYNVGEVKGGYFSGGIIAQVQSGDGTADSPASINITSCYNTGNCEYAFAGCQSGVPEEVTLIFTDCYYTNAETAVQVDDEGFQEPESGATLFTEDRGVWWSQEEARVVKLDVAYLMNEELPDDFGWRYEPNPSATTNEASETHPLILVPNE